MNHFEAACLQSCEEWTAKFKDDAEYAFSEKFEKKMRRLLDKMRNDKYHRFTRNTIKALLVAAIILSLAVTALAIPASREYIITKSRDHFSYKVNDVSGIKKVENIEINYVPEHFVKIGELISDAGGSCEYRNEEYWFVVDKTVIDTAVNFDISEQSVKTVNGIDYTLFSTDNNCGGIIWNNGIYIYSVEGNIGEAELLKIALETK